MTTADRLQSAQSTSVRTWVNRWVQPWVHPSEERPVQWVPGWVERPVQWVPGWESVLVGPVQWADQYELVVAEKPFFYDIKRKPKYYS